MKFKTCMFLAGMIFFAVSLAAGAAGRPTISRVLGSISPRGSIRVGSVLAPFVSALFAGDRVTTNNEQAVIQYRNGTRVVLAAESVANFTQNEVRLERGLMTFRVEANNMVFLLSAHQSEFLVVHPIESPIVARITLVENKASISIIEGALAVLDPSGAQLASLVSGDARLFEEAPFSPEPSAIPPSAPPPAIPKRQTSCKGIHLFGQVCFGVWRSGE